MHTSNIDTSLWVDIGHGLKLGYENDDWIVSAASGLFPLATDTDYFKAVSLLERPYQTALDLLAAYQGAMKTLFPVEKVVRVGLLSKSEHWAERAIEWVPHLPAEQKKKLILDLREVSCAKWANQRTRQIALRELKRLESPSKT